METTICRTVSERPTRRPPSAIHLVVTLPLELDAMLSHDGTRNAFVHLSATQQMAYVDWVTEGASEAIRAIRAMMVSRVVSQIG